MMSVRAICMFLTGMCASVIMCDAQSAITGVIVEKNEVPVAHANVLLLHSKDSSLVKGTLAATDGSFVFEKIPVGDYLITCTSVGFKQTWSSAFYISDNPRLDIGKLILTESSRELNAVTITAKKPLYERKPDRLVINVQNSIASAGSTALDVLERSPGVTVDRQNSSISLQGKEGVALMINGKISYMPANAVLEMLQGMNSGTIEKIELITTPPANFDAEGHAGYINIVLKTTEHSGTNGSFSATAGYGNGLIAEASINMNHRKGKVNIYGNLSYSRIEKPLPINTDTKISNQGTIRESHFLGDRMEAVQNINSRLGLDYQVNAKTVLGILLTGYDNRYMQDEKNEILLVKNNHLDTTQKQVNDELNHWQNISVNLNMQHDFGKDSKLSLNADYIYYKNDQPFHYRTSYYNSSKDFVYADEKMSTKSTPINFWIGAVDYSLRLGKNVTMETGAKVTIADFHNDLGFQRFNQGVWVEDSSLLANYILDENYTAAYASFDWIIDKNTRAKTGLRYEYTDSRLQNRGINITDRHYGNLFPVVTVSHKINDHSTVNLSYNMRIARPTFNNLAPYIYYVNENTIVTGNPTLKPSISNAVTADYIVNKYVFSLSLSKEDNAIASFQPSVDSVGNNVLLRPENVSQKLASAMVAVPVEINNWWNMQYTITGAWQQVEANGARPIKQSFLNVNINAAESFKLPDNITAEISAFYQSRQLEGIYTQKAYGSLNVGVKKKLPGKAGTLTFSANNILNTQEKVLIVNHPEQNLVSSFRINFVQPSFRLTWACSFGNNKVKEKRERTTGAEDEKGRVQ